MPQNKKYAASAVLCSAAAAAIVRSEIDGDTVRRQIRYAAHFVGLQISKKKKKDKATNTNTVLGIFILTFLLLFFNVFF